MAVLSARCLGQPRRSVLRVTIYYGRIPSDLARNPRFPARKPSQKRETSRKSFICVGLRVSFQKSKIRLES